MNVRWSIQAQIDVADIADYIAQDNKSAARETAARIHLTADHLADHPRIGRRGRVRGTWELVISQTPYIVVYRVHRTEVMILRVMHGARRWPLSFA